MNEDQLMKSALKEAQNPFLREKRGDEVEEELASAAKKIILEYFLFAVDYIYRYNVDKKRMRKIICHFFFTHNYYAVWDVRLNEILMTIFCYVFYLVYFELPKTIHTLLPTQ
jgi:hypothetical protein